MAKKKQSRGRKAAGPVARGQEALHRGDYDGAITAWEQAREKKIATDLTGALAEVYFRRGVVRFHRHGQQELGLSDLDKAVRLVPGEPRYAYHLGLAHHCHANRSAALSAYRLALNADPGFTRAAEMIVFALLEQGEDPRRAQAWDLLAVDRQAAFQPLVALVRGEPPTGAQLPSKPDAAAPARLWAGLVALSAGDSSTREALRSAAQDQAQPAPVRAVAAYGLGIDALRRHYQDEALAHWEAARRLGLDTPAFRTNLRLLYRARAQDAASAGLWADLVLLTDAALSLPGNDRDLNELAAAARVHAGYGAAREGNWAQAQSYWARARELGDSSRALAQNLALAYEKAERFGEAAELWREVIRRRPRKSTAPDALTPQQVALLWGHVAGCYGQAGDMDEAIVTLRNAAKSDPRNTDLRLQLVDALVANDQWNAAGNEVARILNREPRNVAVLVRAARIEEMTGYLVRARSLWNQVLELEPDHLEAQERLGEYWMREGTLLLNAGRPDRALASFDQARAYTPDQPYVYLACADCYFLGNNPEAAHQQLERAFALNPTDLDVYHSAVDLCHVANRPADAEWVIAQAEELAGLPDPSGHLPAYFYLELADCCMDRRQVTEAKEYVQRAERLAEGNADGLVDVGLYYLDHDQESQAMLLFDRALRLDPAHGWANFQVGAGYAAAAEMREANRHWRQAMRTALRTGDEELLEAVKTMREQFQSLMDMIDRGLDPVLAMAALGMEMSDEDDDESW